MKPAGRGSLLSALLYSHLNKIPWGVSSGHLAYSSAVAELGIHLSRVGLRHEGKHCRPAEENARTLATLFYSQLHRRHA